MKFLPIGKDSTLTLQGKFYMGFAAYCPAYGTYCQSNCPTQYYEDHDPPYLFPKIEYRKLIDGAWTSGDSTRGIPLAFPIIVPQCGDDLDSVAAVPEGDTALTVSWDTGGLRGIPAGRVAPAVDLWLGPSGMPPDTADTVGFVRVSQPPFTYQLSRFQPGSHDLYARKVCNAQYGIAADWRLVDIVTVPAPVDTIPADTTVIPIDTTDIPIDTTVTPVDTTQGIFDIQNSKFEIQVYPNPASGDITVTRAPAQSADGVFTVTLLDLQGREVVPPTSAATTLILPRATLTPGTYLLRITTPAGTSTRRITVL